MGICVEYFPVGFLLFLCPVLWPVDVYLIGSTARFGGFIVIALWVGMKILRKRQFRLIGFDIRLIRPLLRKSYFDNRPGI